MPRTYRVVFRGPVTDDALDSLPEDQMVWVSGHAIRGARSSTIWVRADDADSAARAVQEALGVPGAVERAEPLLYSVSIEVPEGDVPALERALSARRQASGDVGPVITPASEDAAAELLIDVDAQTDEEAMHLAGQQYAELRGEAGLQPDDPIFRWLYPPWPAHQRLAAVPRYRDLLQRATDLLAQGIFDGAVVAAQSAVEVLVAGQLGQRLQREPIGELRAYILNGVRYHNLNDHRTRLLWQVLTGDTIQQNQAVWSPYQRHLERRNAIVHQGTEVAQDDAAASVASAQAMIEHIESIPFRPR